METIVFWSFKGGGGRTMTLANLACVLARLGKRVLCLDLDLEAPGLPRTLGSDLGSEGFVEYAKHWIDTGDAATLAVEEIEVDRSQHAASPDPDGALLRVVNAGNYANPAGRDAYWKAVISGELEVLFPLPRPLSPSGEVVSAGEIATYQKLYESFWREFRQELASLYPAPDYLLVDTRTGLSPLSQTSIMAFLGGIADEDAEQSVVHSTSQESRQLVIIVDPSSESSKTGTEEFLKRLDHPEVDVTIVHRAQPLLSPLADAGKPVADWLGEAASMVKSVQTVSWDLRVEKDGRPLVPPRGQPTYYPLLDDYLRIVLSVFPNVRNDLTMNPVAELGDSLRHLRRLLGVDTPQPEDFKLFYLSSGGRMRNIKDESPNISLQVKTFQSLLHTLWEHVVAAGLQEGLGPALAHAGRIAGSDFGEKLTTLAVEEGATAAESGDRHRRMEELVNLWCAFDSQVGWGRLQAEFADGTARSGAGVLRVWHNAFAEERKPTDPDLCAFMGGYIGGVLHRLLGREVEVFHDESDLCIRRGDPHCAFRFEPKIDDR